MTALQASSKAHDARLEEGMGHLSESEKAAINQVLLNLERAMTRDEGLPGRDWFKHHIYAPGFLTGYGVKTLPGIREALEARNWPEAEMQIKIAATVINHVAATMDQATRILEGS